MDVRANKPRLPNCLQKNQNNTMLFPQLQWKTPLALRLKWENQQDAIRRSWNGHIAGTDGGIQWKEQRGMGPARTPGAVLSVRIGGPRPSLRAEAVALYLFPRHLLRLLSSPIAMLAPLLVFVDHLILLHVLQHWGG
jgi:hypothetical protein